MKNILLQDVTKNITDGKHGDCREDSHSGYFFISCKDVNDGRIDYSNARQIQVVDFIESHKRTCLEPNDILITNSGSIGRMAYVPNDKLTKRTTFQKSVAIVKPDPTMIYPLYLYYHLLSCTDRLITSANGSAQKNLLLSTMRLFPMLIHEKFNCQHRIADILSAYDDLIENNRKQIALLEEAAQRLYKEWFVDFRFPGHETAEWENGLPKGWMKKKLRDLIEYEIGGGWGEDVKTAKSEHPGYVIRGTDIDDINQGDFSGIPFRYHTKSNIESRILQDGDIVFEVSGGSKNIGVAKVLLITKEFLSYWNHPVICASFCKLIRFANHELGYHAFFAIKYWRSVGITGEYEKKSASSIINFRWQDFLDKQYLIIPSPEIHRKMLSWEKGVFDSIICREKQIQYLTTTRDSLLPRLMSGKIEVTA